jgi:pantothenate kinase
MSALETLLARLAPLVAGPERRLAAVAGPPGSGKSTLAEAAVARFAGAALLPMDGFHYDDAVLQARGRLPRKGAPETFDVGGLAALMARLRADAEDEVAVPVFDRALEISRAGARIIPRAARLVLVEGNWLLLDRPPWTGLRRFFDLTVMLDCPEAALRERLAARWAALPPEQAAAKLEGNDLPNARLALQASAPADLTLTTG